MVLQVGLRSGSCKHFCITQQTSVAKASVISLQGIFKIVQLGFKVHVTCGLPEKNASLKTSLLHLHVEYIN